MTGEQLAKKALDIAQNYKTSYIWGGLGRPITEANIQNAIAQYSVNGKYAAGARRFVGQKNAFFFDCVGLIKCILWGWNGDASKSRGGAVYGSNGVPDTTADGVIAKCSGVSTDFSNVQVGEALWCPGHIGIYIGDGLGVECTPIWSNGVQVTAVGNIGAKSGYNTRKWTKHGKMPYVTYSANAGAVKPSGATTNTSEGKKPTETNTATQASKPEPARSGPDKVYAKSYTVTASALNMRLGAGTNKKVVRILQKGETVRCYGYYTMNGTTTWLFVVAAKDGATGYCSKLYLK